MTNLYNKIKLIMKNLDFWMNFQCFANKNILHWQKRPIFHHQHLSDYLPLLAQGSPGYLCVIDYSWWWQTERERDETWRTLHLMFTSGKRRSWIGKNWPVYLYLEENLKGFLSKLQDMHLHPLITCHMFLFWIKWKSRMNESKEHFQRISSTFKLRFWTVSSL